MVCVTPASYILVSGINNDRPWFLTSHVKDNLSCGSIKVSSFNRIISSVGPVYISMYDIYS